MNEHKIVLGLLRLRTMRVADDQQTVEQVMEPGPRTYRPHVHPEQLRRYFDKLQESASVLVTTADGELIGFVLCEDVERALPRP